MDVGTKYLLLQNLTHNMLISKAPPPKKKKDNEEEKPVKKIETIKDNSPGKENKHDPPNVENTKDEVKKKRDNSQEKTSNAKRRKRIQVEYIFGKNFKIFAQIFVCK